MSKIYVDEIHPKTAGGVITTNAPVVAQTAPVFRKYAAGGKSLPNTTTTLIDVWTTDFDPNSWFTGGTYFQPTVAGYYHMDIQILTNATSNNWVWIEVNKNDSFYRRIGQDWNGGTMPSGSLIVYANGTTDKYSVGLYHSAGSTLITENTADGEPYSNWSGHLIG